MTNLQLSDAEHEGLAEALNLVIDDQENYLSAFHSIEDDYGAEWPEAAQRKAQMLHAVASIAERMGECGTAKRARELAKWCREDMSKAPFTTVTTPDGTAVRVRHAYRPKGRNRP